MIERDSSGRFQNKHGFRKNPHYQCWSNLVSRCTNIKDKQYIDYGGRGINVCTEWNREAGPKAFCEWADETYISGFILDRRDNDKGYSPENCRWVDLFTSANNKRPHKPHKLHKASKKQNNLPRGVYYNDSRRYRAQIRINYKTINIGTFDTAEKASKAFELARSQLRPLL